MENYVLKSAIRIPTSRRSSEFLIGIDFLQKRWDKSVSYYRRSYENAGNNGLNLTITHEIATQFSYPINEVLSWRSSLSVRQDLIHPLATDKLALDRVLNKTLIVGGKTALVFDNSQWKNVNCWKGFRAKLFIDVVQKSSLKEFGMMNLGVDARYSIELFKEVIWVNRLASGASYGGERLLYYMGSVDNWFLPPKDAYNTSIAVNPKENFAFQTLATPMRGFTQNIRNGSRFAIFNSELRIPLIVLFSNHKVRTEVLRTLQVTGFFDVGSAWSGPQPFSDKNFFNTQIIENKPAQILLNKTREPFVAAMGFGARSKIFGYFVRVDFGWGIENGSIAQKPRLFISFSNDI
jgi:hypothetical protein